ncbi:unnamed protein product [Alternaria alternata]
MANEEQIRAFESYMGRTGGSGSGSGSNGQDQNQGQPIPQYPGSFAQPANSYLFSVNFQALEYLLRHQHPHLQPPLPSLRFQDIREAIRRLDTAKAPTVRPESHSAQRRF